MGPKISSVITAESSGGSSNIVGSINLHKHFNAKTLQMRKIIMKTKVRKKRVFINYSLSSSTEPPKTTDFLTLGSLRKPLIL